MRLTASLTSRLPTSPQGHSDEGVQKWFRTTPSLIGITNAEADTDRAVTLAAKIDGHLSVMALRTAISLFGADYPAAAA